MFHSQNKIVLIFMLFLVACGSNNIPVPTSSTPLLPAEEVGSSVGNSPADTPFETKSSVQNFDHIVFIIFENWAFDEMPFQSTHAYI
jgi:hypothetical protein